MFDFFDFLAGEKLVLPEDRLLSDQLTITLKINQPLRKPSLHKYKKTKPENFKPIKLQEIPGLPPTKSCIPQIQPNK